MDGGSGRRGKGSGAGARASVPGGVGGRGTGPRDGANFATCVVFLLFLTRTKRRKMAFLKDALWGGGGTHRSWPGGRGGRPRKGWLGRKGRLVQKGGRTGPRDGANFAKMAFFEGCPVGWGGVPTGAGLVDGGVDQGAGLAWQKGQAWWPGGQGGGARARGGGARASVPGG